MLLFFAAIVVVAVAVGAPKASELSASYSHEMYCKDFGKHYSNPQERKMRERVFQSNLRRVLLHNQAGHSWKAGVNKYSDWTQEEFQRLNGVTPHIHREVASRKEEDQKFVPLPLSAALPPSVDWRTKGILTSVKDQGQCGSCWTFGTTETIEAYWAMKTGNLQEFSEQFLLDCTSNPNDCGGTGGCQGATASLAIQTIMQKGGQPSEWTYPYQSYFGAPGASCSSQASIAQVNGQTHLPSNTNSANIMNYLANKGTLIVNVDASTWQMYESGIFPQGENGCPLNATIDHVVQLVGYGHDSTLNQDYWLVRNSWSPQWGEHGYIRLSRETACGTDNNPGQGNICTGGPSQVPVCGTCGIFYSVSYPLV